MSEPVVEAIPGGVRVTITVEQPAEEDEPTNDSGPAVDAIDSVVSAGAAVIGGALAGVAAALLPSHESDGE